MFYGVGTEHSSVSSFFFFFFLTLIKGRLIVVAARETQTHYGRRCCLSPQGPAAVPPRPVSEAPCNLRPLVGTDGKGLPESVRNDQPGVAQHGNRGNFRPIPGAAGTDVAPEQMALSHRIYGRRAAMHLEVPQIQHTCACTQPTSGEIVRTPHKSRSAADDGTEEEKDQPRDEGKDFTASWRSGIMRTHYLFTFGDRKAELGKKCEEHESLRRVSEEKAERCRIGIKKLIERLKQLDRMPETEIGSSKTYGRLPRENKRARRP